MWAFIVAAALGQSPVSPGQPLPPGHPKFGEPAPNAALPANHPPVADGAKAPSADELIKKLDGMGDELKNRPKSFAVAASLGRLYFINARYPDSIRYLEEALGKAQPLKDFYLTQAKAAGKKPLPAASTVGCSPDPNAELEDQLKKAQAQKDPAAAASCAKVSLQPVMEVSDELASAKFLSHDPAGALKIYDTELALFDFDPEARYGRGALLLDSKGDDLKALAIAKADLEQFLKDYPTHPRAPQATKFLARVNDAIAAGGASKAKPKTTPVKADPQQGLANAPFLQQQQQNGTQPGQPPVLTKEMIDAVQNTPRTPEMNTAFAKLVEEAEGDLAKGQFQDALDKYKRVVPFQPDNGRAKAGMAWSMVRLNRQPMADNVWNVAAQDPAAIDALGDALKAKGDEAGAKQVWQRLAATVPSYASKLSGKL
jgi:hypothetical protein